MRTLTNPYKKVVEYYLYRIKTVSLICQVQVTAICCFIASCYFTATPFTCFPVSRQTCNLTIVSDYLFEFDHLAAYLYRMLIRRTLVLRRDQQFRPSHPLLNQRVYSKGSSTLSSPSPFLPSPAASTPTRGPLHARASTRRVLRRAWNRVTIDASRN